MISQELKQKLYDDTVKEAYAIRDEITERENKILFELDEDDKDKEKHRKNIDDAWTDCDKILAEMSEFQTSNDN